MLDRLDAVSRRAAAQVRYEATAESTLAQYEVGKVTFIAILEANAGRAYRSDFSSFSTSVR